MAEPVVRLAIPLAIRSLSRCWPGCNQADVRPDLTCGEGGVLTSGTVEIARSWAETSESLGEPSGRGRVHETEPDLNVPIRGKRGDHAHGDQDPGPLPGPGTGRRRAG